MDNTSQSSGTQFRPAQQGQPYMMPQQFRPVGQGMPSNVGMPMPPAGQTQPLQFSQPMQPPPWPNHPPHVTPSSQPLPLPPYHVHPNRPPLTSGPPQLQQSAPPFVPSSFGQLQTNAIPPSQFQPMPQMHAPVVPAGGQPWLPSGSNGVSVATPVQPTGHQPSVSSSSDLAVNVPNQQSSSDWQEHTASDGRRYYYNKRTKQSSWEKPLELMTPLERADASTVWKEFTTPEGKKYYYNKVTKQSKWSMPDELKLAREQAQQTASQGTKSEADGTSHASVAVNASLGETSTTAIPVSSNSSSTMAVASSPVPVTPIVAVSNPAVVVPSPSALPVAQSIIANAAGVQPPSVTIPVLSTAASTNVPAAVVNTKTTYLGGFDNFASQGAATSVDGVSMQNTEEVKKGAGVPIKSDANSTEEKNLDDEPLVFASKLEAKNAFKALLESANVQSDWTWEQTMREIINDKRYGALRTLGERKQAFNEYLGQRKKIEAEERRMRQKRAREEFTKMLEESKELTSSMKWSKAVSLFENDERFKAVEKARDREDLFDNYIVELGRKEREKAAEDHKRNVTEFKKFLESCDFIKVNSQWRKVQDRLEDDERCLCLEKLDRLLVFQDYIRDLEKEEEEQKKIQKEQLRRVERKNRDGFRKLLEEHVADGSLTAKTHWLDYCLKVKDLPQYHAVATNTSGSTPKDLFEDVAEELEKQYRDDKSRVKDAMKSGKIIMTSTWTFEDFKAAILDDVGSPPLSDMNLKLVYDELLERAKEKEEKEAKKRQRLADDLTKLLHTYKLGGLQTTFEESQEYRAIGEESSIKEIFEEYIAHLQEKVKEKERKREEEKAKKEKDREEKEKRKEKERKEKEKDREREKGKERSKKDETDSENVDATDSYGHKEDRKKEKDKDRRHRKRHQSDDISSDKDEKEESKKSRRHEVSSDKDEKEESKKSRRHDVSSDKDEKEESKKSRRHGSERKKSRKHSYTPESDSESRHKRHKRDQRDGSRRHGGYDDLEDGEVGEDGEIQ